MDANLAKLFKPAAAPQARPATPADAQNQLKQIFSRLAQAPKQAAAR